MNELKFDPAKEIYINLATYRKTGVSVNTPVWVAAHEGNYYVFSEAKAGKVKRLRNNTKIKIAPCDVRGKIHGEWIEGNARIVVDQLEINAMYPAFTEKYGLQMRLANFLSRLTGRFDKRAIIAFTLTAQDSTQN
jgi:PPOX class probable F420-dependent enzyme